MKTEKIQRNIVMNVRLSEGERADLIKVANHDDKSIAAVVRSAIRQYVAVRKTG